MNKRRYNIIFALTASLLPGLCLVTAFAMLGSGLTLWLTIGETRPRPTSEGRLTYRLVSFASATPRASDAASATIRETETPTPWPTQTTTPVPSPSQTPTLTLTPAPSATPAPSVTPTPSLPTVTPVPTASLTPPPPDFPFVIKETAGFETNHFDFDVYIAITDADNKPLSGYRVIGTHSSGLLVESQVSAHDWTVNSGAMHYKGGNLKYQAFNSPSGRWALQLVDEAGQPVAPLVEFPFDPSNPSWYFILYRRD